MDTEDLPSDSDESDVDYAPSGEDSNPPSEVDSDGDVEENPTVSGDEDAPRGIKRKSKQKSAKKKVMKALVQEEDEGEDEEQKQLTEEEEKKKTDSLWSDFLTDTSTKRPVSSEISLAKEKTVMETSKPETPKPVIKDKKVTITKIFEFAGEEVRVTKDVPLDSAEARLLSDKPKQPSPGVSQSRPRPTGGLRGLSAVLGQLGKKEKIGTLEKSKLDWDRFKKAEGIEDEVLTHNRGKNGYLEKQDFLQRADVRQFEIEKDLRTTKRSNR